MPAKRELSCIYLDNKSYKLAVSNLKETIILGCTISKLALGTFYYFDEYNNRNNKLAFKWFLEAYKDHNIDSMYYLGECYAHGYGINKNPSKAIDYLIEYIDNSSKNDEHRIDAERLIVDCALDENEKIENREIAEKVPEEISCDLNKLNDEELPKSSISNIIDFSLYSSKTKINKDFNVHKKKLTQISKKFINNKENLNLRIPDYENFLINLEIDDFSRKMIEKYFKLKSDIADYDEYSHVVNSLFKACEKELVNLLKLTNLANTFDENNNTDINFLINRLKDWIYENLEELNLPKKWKKNIRDFGKLLRVRNKSAHLNEVQLNDLLPTEKITKKLFLQLEEMKIFIRKK